MPFSFQGQETKLLSSCCIHTIIRIIISIVDARRGEGGDRIPTEVSETGEPGAQFRAPPAADSRSVVVVTVMIKLLIHLVLSSS